MGANYKRDALSLMAVANAQSGNDGEIKAPKFKPIFVQDLQLTRSVNRAHDLGIPTDKSIHSVALKFINHDCKVSVDNPIVMPIYISKVILNASRTTTLRQELDQLLSALSAMDAPFAAKFSGVISRLLTEARYQNTEVEPIVIQFDHEEEEGLVRMSVRWTQQQSATIWDTQRLDQCKIRMSNKVIMHAFYCTF
ncbi:hypothetical protein CcCBS67573_g06242 [Chytriomyces confervae]|uniref:Uncharacterized protein n=1 Tax=Chytriomyces confervae TaxID=246404 RepID=A0A507F6Q2_9FUNG|nr:hypothetical protein CcCBS67573_g06242 [Chytriomyces confervae]